LKVKIIADKSEKAAKYGIRDLSAKPEDKMEGLFNHCFLD
jgi:hypothetical protein